MLSSKAIVGLIASGVLSVSAVALTFNGEGTINQAINQLRTNTSKMELFKNNENVLANKINELKTSKKDLLNQIEQLQGTNSSLLKEKEILIAKVKDLEVTIKNLEEQLENSGGDTSGLQAENDRLNKELNKANGEIDKANKLVADLQTTLDSLKNTPNPLSQEELDKILNDTTDEGGGGEVSPPFTDEEYANASAVFKNGEGYYDLGKAIGGSSYVYIQRDGTVEVCPFVSAKIKITYYDGTVENYDDGYMITGSGGIIDNSVKTITITYQDGTSDLILVEL